VSIQTPQPSAGTSWDQVVDVLFDVVSAASASEADMAAKWSGRQYLTHSCRDVGRDPKRPRSADRWPPIPPAGVAGRIAQRSSSQEPPARTLGCSRLITEKASYALGSPCGFWPSCTRMSMSAL
jgi:hypothetical protein